jgi:hypothetical protein
MIPLIEGQLYTKWLVGLINIPFMYFNRWIMFRRPGLTKGTGSEYSGSVLA